MPDKYKLAHQMSTEERLRLYNENKKFEKQYSMSHDNHLIQLDTQSTSNSKKTFIQKLLFWK